mgnify:CR=1 FL=1
MDFRRTLSPQLIEALNEEYDRPNSWWKPLIDYPAFIAAIRKDYLNVYRNGCSIAKISLVSSELVAETHYKYLVSSKKKPEMIRATGGDYQYTDPSKYFIPSLSDRKTLIASTDLHGGIEKTGVHKIIMSNPNVIDTEIAFSNEESEKQTDRIDICVVRTDTVVPTLRFIEAKDVSYRGALRSGETTQPKVLGQLERYAETLEKYQDDIIEAYRQLLATVRQLKGNRWLGIGLKSIDTTKLALDPLPYLAIFGFDGDHQKNPDSIHNHHMQRLISALGKDRVLLKGDPEGFVNGISK